MLEGGVGSPEVLLQRRRQLDIEITRDELQRAVGGHENRVERQIFDEYRREVRHPFQLETVFLRSGRENQHPQPVVVRSPFRRRDESSVVADPAHGPGQMKPGGDPQPPRQRHSAQRLHPRRRRVEAAFPRMDEGDQSGVVEVAFVVHPLVVREELRKQLRQKGMTVRLGQRVGDAADGDRE